METVELGYLTYLLENEKEYTIIRCDENALSVEIPLEVNGIPVTKIGEAAFEDCQKLTSITFPDDIELQIRDADSFEIGDYAFNNCISLTEIEIPYGVHSIGRGAFRNCRSLTKAELPTIFLYVAPYAFCGCEALKTVTPIDTIGEGVFEDCRSLENFPVAQGTTSIDEDAFRGCYSITDAVIPASVTSLEPLAFRSCRGLKSVTFENPVGWSCRNRYTRKVFDLDLSDPEKNAKMLSSIDFDDGVGTWRRS
jgi:hypothetical protein